MKLTELQNVLGEQVNKVKTGGESTEETAQTLQQAQTIAMLAKQMINNADIIIRFDKLKTLSPETQARIESLI